MMKRLTAVFLAMLLLFSATALADWEEGLGPHKPYRTSREIDLTTQIGYMMFHPNANMPVAGAKTLRIYLPREDVKLNSAGGNLTVRSADGVEKYTIAINDPDRVILRPMIPNELEGLMWGGGICVEITLDVSPRLGCTYYVDMDRALIVDPSETFGNDAAKGEDHWRFDTSADYGVSQLKYLRDNNGTEETVVGVAKAGDKARFDLVIGGEVKSAILIPLDTEEKIVFPPEMTLITETCEVIGDVIGDDPAWGVMFFDTEVPPMDENAVAEHMVEALSF